MKRIIFLFALIGLIPGVGLAKFHRGYGKAGCGLGSMIMGRKGNQVLAATTNATFSSQIFGITTGTSNCGTRGLDTAMNDFIEANKVALASDIAQGGGETIASISEYLKCANQKTLSETLQNHYGTIFPDSNASVNYISDTISTLSAAPCKIKNI